MTERLATVLVLIFVAALAPPATAQDGDAPTAAVFAELGGAAGEAVSFNYDVRYANFGFRLGATLDPGDMDSERAFGESERDPDEPYGLLGLAHLFVEEGPFALEVGAGPALRIREGRLAVRAAGHVGVRVQPIFDRLLVRVGYAPTYGAGGFEGYVALGVGYQISL